MCDFFIYHFLFRNYLGEVEILECQCWKKIQQKITTTQYKNNNQIRHPILNLLVYWRHRKVILIEHNLCILLYLVWIKYTLTFLSEYKTSRNRILKNIDDLNEFPICFRNNLLHIYDSPTRIQALNDVEKCHY